MEPIRANETYIYIYMETRRKREREKKTYKSTTEFVKHPMVRGIEPLQMLLQTSRLYNKQNNKCICYIVRNDISSAREIPS